MKQKEQFEQLIVTHHPMIVKIARVYSQDADDYHDLYQEILISIWSSLKRFKGNSALSTWLYRVALNTGMSYYRKGKKQKNKLSLDQIPEPNSVPNSSSEKEQKIKALYDAISQLKPPDRAVMLLYLEEKTYEQIAEISGLSPSNVGVKINRLKKSY